VHGLITSLFHMDGRGYGSRDAIEIAYESSSAVHDFLGQGLEEHVCGQSGLLVSIKRASHSFNVVELETQGRKDGRRFTLD
jgi:hypothetical protein